MKIQTFRDGERFVVVFEGIDVKEENLIKGLLGPMVCENITSEPQVEPLAPIKEEPPVIPSAPAAPPVFTFGPYKGKTPQEILNVSNPQEGAEAYGFICLSLNRNAVEGDFSKTCEEEVRKYLRNRFANTDGEEYAKKLSDKQVEMFYGQFKFSIPSEMNNGSRDMIPAIINHFKTI